MPESDEPLPPHRSLHKLPNTECFYQGTNDNQELLFRPNIFDNAIAGNHRYLHESSVIALGLTEVCCRRGIGKVGRLGQKQASTAKTCRNNSSWLYQCLLR